MRRLEGFKAFNRRDPFESFKAHQGVWPETSRFGDVEGLIGKTVERCV